MQKLASILGLAMLNTLAAPSVLAQQSEDKFIGLEEIIVTANKRVQNLQEVPMSVSAFTEDFFKDTGETDFNALEQYTPSLKIQSGPDSRSTSIRIRGIGSTGSNIGIDPSVGIFIDGVYQGRAGMSVSDLVDISRVEVLRGPQGTLYGKNTAAGAISVFTAQPTEEREGNIEFTYNSDNQKELRGMVNLPMGDNGNAARISGFAINGDHKYTNSFNGEGLNDANKWGMKSRFLFNLENSELLVNFDYTKEDTDCCALAIIDYDGFSPGQVGTPLTDKAYTEAGLSITALEDLSAVGSPPSADPFNEDNYWLNDPLSNKVEVGGISTEWNFDLASEDSITFINAWRTYTSNSSYDSDLSAYNAASPANTNVEVEQFSSELRITSPGGETWDYQGGLYAFYSKSETQGSLGMNRLILENATEVNGIALGSFLGQSSINIDQNTHETTSLAAFGQLVYNPTEKLSATLGLRITQEEKKRTGSQRTLRTPWESSHPLYNPFLFSLPLDIAPIAGPDVDFDQSRTDTNVSPALNLRYFWNDDFMTYASVSKGFKSGGFDQRRVLVTDASLINGGNDKAGEFDEEEALSYELGWKSTLMDGRVTFNGTFYFVDYDNFQAQAFDGASTKVTNAGSLQSYGSEIDLTFAASANLTLGTAIGYNKAEYKEFDGGQCTATDTFFAFQVDPTVPCVVDLAGQPLDNAPEITFSSYAQYERSLNNDLLIIARAEHNYVDSFYLDQDLDQNLYNEKVDLVNLRVTLANENRDWEVALWGKNVLDEKHYIMGIDIPTVGGYAGVVAERATYGLTLRRNFQ